MEPLPATGTPFLFPERENFGEGNLDRGIDVPIQGQEMMDISGLFAWVAITQSQIIPLFAIAVGGSLVLVFLCRIIRMIEFTSRNYYQAQLKMKMIDKGYSASEIERVVQLQVGDPAGKWEPLMPAKPERF